MQQRQLRLGDILDDYCTRERRLTNHAVVAMVGDDVKQTRCTTCDTEHEYKHAKVPRQRRKADSPAALYAQVAAGAPKRVTAPPPGTSNNNDTNADDFEPQPDPAIVAVELLEPEEQAVEARSDGTDVAASLAPDDVDLTNSDEDEDEDADRKDDEGPVHRPLIRASLPRDGQPPAARPIPEFTIRQPGGRPNRFRPRHQGHQGGGGQPFRGDRSNGNGFGGPGGPGGQRSAGPRHTGGRPPQGAVPSRMARRHGPGRKRQK
jgi:translation initiation factor IF-2